MANFGELGRVPEPEPREVWESDFWCSDHMQSHECGSGCPGWTDRVFGSIQEKDATIERLNKELAEWKSLTYCAYCGQSYPADNAAAEQVSKHIAECPRHPMRIVEGQRDAAQREVERLRGHLNHSARMSVDGQPCWCPRPGRAGNDEHSMTCREIRTALAEPQPPAQGGA